MLVMTKTVSSGCSSLSDIDHDPITSTFAKLREVISQEASLRKELDALFIKKMEDAHIAAQNSQNYLGLVKAQEANMREILETESAAANEIHDRASTTRPEDTAGREQMAKWEHLQEAARMSMLEQSHKDAAEKLRHEQEEHDQLTKLEEEILAELETERLAKEEENHPMAQEAAMTTAAEAWYQAEAEQGLLEEERRANEEDNRMQEAAMVEEPTLVIAPKKKGKEKKAKEALRRLGPGLLPVLMASRIHEESHTLMAVTVTPPDLPVGTVDTNSDTPRPFEQPHQSDVTSAVPHPNAYYCSKCNGWVIVRGQLTSEPPIYSSYNDACQELNFPSARVDKQCNSQEHSSYGGGSGSPDPLEAHHYHLYEDAIPSTSLNPPFARNSWEVPPSLPRKVCGQHESVTEDFWELPTNIMLESEPEEMHHDVDLTADYLDLYACCVCTQNIYVTRKVIPGIVSPSRIMDLRRERFAVDRDPTRIAVAFEFIVKMLESLLWRGEHRPINYQGNFFQRTFGNDTEAMRIWEQLGYHIDTENKHLVPPALNTSEVRQGLLRAWVELSAYTADFHRNHPQSTADRMKDGHLVHKLWVGLSDASDEIAGLIGSHPNQIPRGTIEAPQAQYDPIFEFLGLTQSSFTPKLLAQAYKLQTHCDITRLPIYLEGLTTLVENILPSLSDDTTTTLVTEELGDLIVLEGFKDRWIPDDRGFEPSAEGQDDFYFDESDCRSPKPFCEN